MAGNSFTVDQLIRDNEKNNLNEAIIQLIKSVKIMFANSTEEVEKTQLDVLNNLDILKTPSKTENTAIKTPKLPPQLRMGKLSVDQV